MAVKFLVHKAMGYINKAPHRSPWGFSLQANIVGSIYSFISSPFITLAILILSSTIFFTLLLPCPARATSATQIIFSGDSREIWVDGIREELPEKPYLSGDYIMVPLRYLAEKLGGQVQWEPGPPETIKVSLRNHEAIIYPGSKIVFLLERDQPGAEILPAEIQKIGQLVFAPAIMFYKVFNIPYARWPEGGAYLLGSTNRPPTAYFEVSQPAYAGQPLHYTVKAQDPEGDPIVEERWIGRQEVFPEEGLYTVTLQVKDSRGSWSIPFSRTIKVLPAPLALQPGDLWPEEKISPTFTYKPTKKRTGPILLFSDSPEYIERPGILYRDEIEGEARLYFWHAIQSPLTFKIYVVAFNPGQQEVKLTIEKEGYGGPSNNVYQVAKEALIQYFNATQSRTLRLKPGEALILNKIAPSAVRHQVLHGIMDVYATAKLQIFFVALPATADVLKEYTKLPYLPADGVHTRGTFGPSDIEMELFLSGRETGSLVLADGQEDEFLPGKGSAPSLTGNYGALYKLKLLPTRDIEVFLVPVSGYFGGIVVLEGNIIEVPRQGFVEAPEQAIFVGKLKANRPAELYFIPPGGSCLPVKLVFKPS